MFPTTPSLLHKEGCSPTTPSLLRKEGCFPTTPSLLRKEGSTAFSKPLSPQGTGGVTAPTRRSEPLSSEDGGASKPSPDCLCGVNRLAEKAADDAAETAAFTTNKTNTFKGKKVKE